MSGGFLLIVIVALAGGMIQFQLRSKFKKYGQMPLQSNLSGKEVAEKMLMENGISDVSVVSVEGRLTDHYNPANKTVNLSPDVYHGRSIASAAVAAHECGHAVQHAQLYSWLQLRSALVPIVSASSSMLTWVLILGILTISVFPYLLLAGIILFSLTTVFSFVTLPVEFDASRRALIWLKQTNVVEQGQEMDGAKDALSWAAGTYVVAAISSLATLLYYIGIFRNNS